MKCTIPEISWHNRDPVLSLDIQQKTNEDFYRLASGGTDNHVLIWHLRILDNGATSLESVSDLTRHQRAVNVVRWSPSTQYLASGDDDGNIIIWQQKADDLAIMLDGDDNDKEKWSVLKILRGHKEDVYDICWSPDSTKLISGSVDNTAIIWDLTRGLNDCILTDHKGFVQGVTWDPLGQFVATMCSDRTCRIFTETGKKIRARISKGTLPVLETHLLHGQTVRYFHDDTLKSFFRRLSFSPDGNLIITPSGFLESGENKKLYTSYIFTIESFTQPAVILPSPGQFTTAVKFCPKLFQIRPEGPDSVIALPYRMVFAVATRSSIILYDTQQMSPFGTVSNIHYTRLTDLSWSSDGRLLIVSSTDGFCSLITFEPNELGIEYVKETETIEQEVNEELNDTVEEIMETVSIEEKKEKRPSFLEQWTKKVKTESEEKSDTTNEVIITEPEEKENVLNDVKSISEPVQATGTAKPIAVRRKPRDQMNITQFLKQPKPLSLSPSSKAKSKANKQKSTQQSSVILLSDDSLPREPWSPQKMQVDTKNINDVQNSDSEVSTTTEVADIINIEDDSQDLRLVLEESQSNLDEKMDVDEIKPTDNSKGQQSEQIDLTNELSTKIKEKHCKSIESKCDIKTESKEISSHISPVPNKKRVPLITLSSPKLKKKPF